MASTSAQTAGGCVPERPEGRGLDARGSGRGTRDAHCSRACPTPGRSKFTASAWRFQRVTPQALTEVRDAVQDYRRLAITDALDRALAAPSAAGIETVGRTAPPADVESMLAWAWPRGRRTPSATAASTAARHAQLNRSALQVLGVFEIDLRRQHTSLASCARCCDQGRARPQRDPESRDADWANFTRSAIVNNPSSPAGSSARRSADLLRAAR